MIKRIKKNKGFALLYAVMISSIILAITLGIMDVSLKELKFSTSAQDTNNAFFAADTGAECALYYDNFSDSTKNAFTGTAASSMTCAGKGITLTGTSPNWYFAVPGLGGGGQGCAEVAVYKSTSTTATVTSHGYNIGSVTNNVCNPGTNSADRELQVNY